MANGRFVIKDTMPKINNISMTRCALALMFILTALTGVVNQLILSIGIILCLLILFCLGKLSLGFPFMIFYGTLYGWVFGLSVLTIYVLLSVVYTVISITGDTRLNRRLLVPVIVYLLFDFFVFIPQKGFMFAITIALEVMCLLIVANELTTKKGAITDFFKIYVFVCLISFFTGMLFGNTIGGEYDYERFNATFEDPNYMGFFFTIAIFAVITLRLFKNPIVRYAIVVVLYLMIMTSLSITAIVVNLCVWLIYTIFISKRKAASLIVILSLGIIFFSVISYGMATQNDSFIGNLGARISDKLDSLAIGDTNAVTTGRSGLLEKNMSYYLSSPILTILFGGTSVNCRYIVPEIGSASHNEYADFLLNIGLVGAAIMIAFFLTGFREHLREYKRTESNEALCLCMGKLVWMFYAFTLTMFLDYRFMLIFLI